MAQKQKNAPWANCCEDWGGYMAAKKAKLEQQFQETVDNEFTDRSKLFNGIAIFVNGYTEPSSDELKRIMMAHGGTYHQYLRSQRTTHMIASNLPYSKIVQYKKAKNPLPLCKPEWITDSIKEGKLLDYKKYLLYSNATKTQPAIFAHMSKQIIPETQTSFNTCNSMAINATEKTNNKIISIKETSEVSQISAKPSNSEIPSAVSNCTRNPKFLTEFYNNSRLHHIATMGAIFKDYINDLRDKNNGNFPGLDALKKQLHARQNIAGPSKIIDNSDSDDDLLENNKYTSNITVSSEKNRIIMHIDMDCFFVSVGLRKHPELRGFPVAVAHAKGNKQNTLNDADEYGSMSEVASCSYEARKTGVKNGMLLGQALKLCPDLKTISYDFDGYKEVSYTLYDTVASYTLDIEAVSCDEMYADCTKLFRICGLTPLEFATIIRNEIKEKTGCPVSTGFGSNKLQARLATKKAKPDGQYYLIENNVKSFIKTLNLKDLPGIGYSTSYKLHQMNVQTCADLQTISLYELQKEFGKKNGQQLHDACRGIDDSKLNLEHVRKSISAEVNYGIRFENTEAAHEFLQKLSIEISNRLQKINSKGRCITLKVMFRAKEAPNEPKKFMGHGLCDVFNKSKNLIASTDDSVVITREVLSLWNQFNQNPEDARGIGIQITKLECSKGKSSEPTILKLLEKMKDSTKHKDELRHCCNLNMNETKNEIKHNRMNNCHLSYKTKGSQNCNEQDINEINSELETELFTKNINFSYNNINQKINENNYVNNSEQDKKLEKEYHKIQILEQTTKSSSQLKQTKQSEYFKHVKRASSIKSGKIQMPNINEIDMKVLIELPEDIRNEILNEYKAINDNENQNDDSNRECTTINSDRNGLNSINKVENYLTFSQVDPEFLAALPEEMKNEVKSYCDAQKKERVDQINEKCNKTIANKGWNMFKNEKKPQKFGKLKPGKLKVTKSGGKREAKNFSASHTKNINLEEISRINIQNSEIKLQSYSKEKVLSANRSVHFDCSNGNLEHSEILSNLVNCLLDLPVPQVKLQIRDWVNNNTDINDVDFLSLTTFLGTLPRKKRIGDLHTLLKCLNRYITESNNCVWHETYKKMLIHIQPRMRLEYGYELMIPNYIECIKCEIVSM